MATSLLHRLLGTLGQRSSSRVEPLTPPVQAYVTSTTPTATLTSSQELRDYPPVERWQDWTEYDPKAWPQKVARRYTLVPTVCFNCESACGLLAYVDVETLKIKKFEGNPLHPGSRGRNCAKGPATLNQVYDPDRILYPLKRAGKRGEGKWVRVSWDEALDDIAGRIRKAIIEKRQTEIIYHVGRPGHDGFMEWVLPAWGVDGHNSHTNVCSSGARCGQAMWMGLDRPSPDHANARVILLISSHLETGHYFNPHAQRIMEGKMAGAKLIVLDTRLSNTASLADEWLSPWPGSETAILLAIANYLIRTGQYNRDFVRRWVNWADYLRAEHPDLPVSFEHFEMKLQELYAQYTFEFAAQESGVSAEQIERVAKIIARCEGKLATHSWRSATSANLGGWMVARCLWFLNVLTGSIGVEGGTSANVWDKWIPRHPNMAPHVKVWNELTWPQEYPLNFYEMSILLPHFLKEGRGKVDTYFTRVYNPLWTNPDGMSWLEVLTDESKIGLHVHLSPTWSETGWFADYILPMGVGAERHDVMSQETHAGCWIAFRQPVLREAMRRLGKPVNDTRDANPGEVWEEVEFWIELSWRIDPDGSLGIRKTFESPYRPGQKITVDEFYGWMFENHVPGLPEAAAKEGLTPLEYMRRYGAFELRKGVQPTFDKPLSAADLSDATIDPNTGIVYTKTPAPPSSNITPLPYFEPDPERGRPIGIKLEDGSIVTGFPTPSRRLEFYSTTLRDWGWPEYAIPTYIHSHVHPSKIDRSKNEAVLLSTFRLPTLIHTRSGNAKWLYEISHKNPVWIHTSDAERLGLRTGDLIKVVTEIGYFVDRVWVTEGIRPGVIACSHHLGRWRLQEDGGGRLSTALVELKQEGQGEWRMRQLHGIRPYESDDPDTSRIWWEDAGVHQNLTFAVHPDPISGMHCWHQKVRLEPAGPNDRYGDIYVDTKRAHEVYREWLAMTRPASKVSPNGMRRPHWLLRPFRPAREAYFLPEKKS
ncbi:MAG TPA: formate dehydrogenase [Chloroflexus aurantiacus]|jgi:anaerobic selenocysteine-containing dehydrogenase|uniref:Nitrate reductase n=1 Tax=Chloroflexus aurantiacus (strain ATCC 29366 / DSM 635 / J-10-fl) TaxID=324602 RepID=A9WIA3_CHLAA|nr:MULTISPECIES: molybdopterin-dependent oxidoreductase [Chloroflexus]ABY36395.1 Nitrate reductase [Chloroflexus aurantiacus J-10-fl]RMG48570.1 MAG: formate dehydrogenase [Chloroflexota bacterium]HBW67882.1 formate dehydrogenase [Chloroflexus aurantiacus]